MFKGGWKHAARCPLPQWLSVSSDGSAGGRQGASENGQDYGCEDVMPILDKQPHGVGLNGVAQRDDEAVESAWILSVGLRSDHTGESSSVAAV